MHDYIYYDIAIKQALIHTNGRCQIKKETIFNKNFILDKMC